MACLTRRMLACLCVVDIKMSAFPRFWEGLLCFQRISVVIVVQISKTSKHSFITAVVINKLSIIADFSDSRYRTKLSVPNARSQL